jgi:Holliday junction resolvasome RuvABC endonuclease subunit
MGIDQSFTSTGIWISDENGNHIHHELITTKKDKDDPLTNFKRASFIADQILSIVDDFGIEYVIIEALAYGSMGDATRNLAGLQYLIITGLINRGGISIDIVAPTSLKKQATTKGNAKKEEMYECCPQHVKDFVDPIPKSKGKYDLVDAYFLSIYKKTT